MEKVLRQHTLAQVDDPVSLSSWLQEEAGMTPEQPIYALMDGAQIENLRRVLRKSSARASGALFGALGKPDLEEAGGWLVDLGTATELSSECMETTCQEALARPSVMWLQSPLSHHYLLDLLATRLDAKLKRGPEAYFRYYDPRIFSNLVAILTPEQAPYLAMASRWYWLDHDLKRRILEIPLDIDTACSFVTPIEFDRDQENYLIDGSLPYEMMMIFEEEDPGALEPIPRNERYSLLRMGVDKALANGQRGLYELYTTCVEVLSEKRGEIHAP